MDLKKIFWVVLIFTICVWIGVGIYFLRTTSSPKTSPPKTTISSTQASVPNLPTPTFPVKLQEGLKEIRLDDEEETSLVHGRIESIKESVATIVTLNSRLVIRLTQLPLYQAPAIEFNIDNLIPAKISDFKVLSEVVIAYNHLGYPEKIVLIKS